MNLLSNAINIKEFKERYDEQYITDKLSWCRKTNSNSANYMFVVPIPFSIQGAQLLQHTKSLLEDPDNLIQIDKSFDKLLTGLRTAIANEYKLDKEQTSYDDILDAFRLALTFYRRSK